MRKVSLWILSLVILVILVFIIAPYYVGTSIQSQLNQHIEKLKQTKPDVKIKVLSYKRAWNHSDVKLQVTYPIDFISGMNGFNMPAFTTVLNAHISHGPFVSYKGEDGKNQYGLAMAAITVNSDDKEVDGSATTLVHWNHSISTNVNVKQLNLSNKTMNLIITGLRGAYTYSPSQQSIQYSFQADKAQGQLTMNSGLSSNKVNYLADNIGVHGKLQKVNALWYGTRIDRVSNLVVNEDKKVLLSFKNRQSTFNMMQNGSKTDIYIDTKVDAMSWENWAFGPSVLTANAKGLDTESLANLMKQWKMVFVDNKVTLGDVTQLAGPAMSLVKKGFTVNLQKLQLNNKNMKSAPVTADATLKLAAVDNSSLESHYNAISASGNVSMPRQLAITLMSNFYEDMLSRYHDEDASATALANKAIMQWINTKMLMVDSKNQSVSMTFSFDKGKLLINGQTPHFSLPHAGDSAKTIPQSQQQQPRKGFFFK